MLLAIPQASLVRSCKAGIGAPKHNVASRTPKFLALRPAPRHVTYGSKVADAEAETKAEKKVKEEEEDEDEFEGDDGLNPQQVESLLTILCEETEIAELNLKMGGFRMRVRRSLSNGAAAAPEAAPAPVAAAPAPAPAAPAPAPAAAPAVASGSYDSDEEVDHTLESLTAISSSKVGILRRGRYVKGKQVGKGPVVEVGDIIKRGQTLCYVEQLGTHWPVEAPAAGEVMSFEVDEGGPVEYKQVVAYIRPEFGSQDPGFGVRK